jgi:hypothetical protein
MIAFSGTLDNGKSHSGSDAVGADTIVRLLPDDGLLGSNPLWLSKGFSGEYPARKRQSEIERRMHVHNYRPRLLLL